MTHKIGIIGGGAAGMMAAMSAKSENSDVSVTIFDKNPSLGAKVIISGGGRCNVTTGYTDVEEVLKKYPRGNKFLKNAMYAFGPADTYKWFEDHGVKLKVEKDMRVFPVSNDGHDIVGAFEQFFDTQNVDVKCGTDIKSVKKVGEKFILTNSPGKEFEFDRLIVTTGGQAYRHTGSSGDGYCFAEALGHSTTSLGPSLNSFVLAETFAKDLAGVSLENVTMRAILKDGKKVSYSGPFVWTHKGISGPATFAMSAFSTFEICSKESPLILYVDFVPSLTLRELETHAFDFIKNYPKKPFFGIFHEFMPKSVLQKLIQNSANPCNETKHTVVRSTCEKLKNHPLTVIGRGQGSEFVTAGGVDTAEIDPKTMESRICEGLFFAGEVMNIDGFTGGYNLQASWATGRMAGINAADEDADMGSVKNN
ncbi:MAG: aminoacetone oxidase family FAD-binding enzyme [Candidatus Peregrinibacteria bacterium]|nr:aminoacetone oxidase family FAD-binding enzyme [Candidatus Peregrinibacteria bacterium]MDZ4244798.1 aminoacetone oxidase family FAD-binding enzyme [Candidatus Gracilibacteria bacterium]